MRTVKIALLDYGVGNLQSLTQAFEDAGAAVVIEADAKKAFSADALVLPGVGAFGAAAMALEKNALALREALAKGHPCLGVCLGMQLLLERSEEGAGNGLAVLPGRVRALHTPLTPHIGWNDVDFNDDVLFRSVNPMTAYFANSYAVEVADATLVSAWTEYEGDRFPAAVRLGKTCGVQFHPEKSGPAGLQLIRNFMDLVRA